MIRISQLKLPITHSDLDLKKKAAKMLRISDTQIQKVSIVRQSIDARHKNDLLFVYTIDIELPDEQKVLRKVNHNNIMSIKPKAYVFPKQGTEELNHRPIIIGFGPAGLFCGYMLAKAGYRPLILERGAAVEQRQADVEQFWKDGVLHPESNVQFGEGGAGTFSDGKLNTLVKDKEGRGHEVMKIFVEHGASEEILYQQKPHLGTDVLIDIVRNMRNQIIAWGGEVRFSSKVTDVSYENQRIVSVTVNDQEIIPADVVVLAPGHSARDTFFMLHERGIKMEAKSFAVGVRIEHPQEMINISQYGQKNVPQLGAASYKLTHQTDEKINSDGTIRKSRGIFSFCMCPGGYVVNASSEQNLLAVNGMSYQSRDSKNANSALIVTVTPEDYKEYGREDLPEELYGIAFQRDLERKAFLAGDGKIPVQIFKDYKNNVKTEAFGEITPCMKGGYAYANVRQIFPDFIGDAIEEGILAFGKKIKGYDRDDALISGVESRSSSPVRITRNDHLESEIQGFYPCGEGAGYAGGITSAAMDGIKVAESIAKKYINLAQSPYTQL